jgi:branched-chain amino acid transport system permease protein
MQIVFNILLSASIYILIGIGFSLIYKTAGFIHFAHGAVFTAGAYFAFLFKVWLGFPVPLAFLSTIACTTLLGCAIELTLYRPLRQRKAPSQVFLLTSLGLYIVLQNLIAIIFGDATRSLDLIAVQAGISIFNARLTPVQLAIITLSPTLVLIFTLLLQRTKVGLTIRAVANNPELANITGIDSNQVILNTFALGSALAGIAGILVSLDLDMTPTMGMNALMMAAVAVIIGGVGSISGVVLGALFLSLTQNLATLLIGGQWQDAIAFALLTLFLLFRPQGFFGKPIRRATI